MADLLLQAMEARQSGDIVLTKQLLAQALVQNPRNEGAWMMMSEVVNEVKLKRNCLQRVLLINPKNEAARIALTKLDTSPFGPSVRGQAYRPTSPAKNEELATFTPPFSWTEEDAEYQALENIAYLDQTVEQASHLPDTPTTFDWAAESDEPDKTIERIFETVSNPEKAATPLPDTDINWLQTHPTSSEAQTSLTDQEKEARLLDELVGATTAARTHAEPISDEYKVDGEYHLGMETFAAPDEYRTEENEPEALLWDNPKAKADRLVILGSKSIIVASPAASDIQLIIEQFKEQKMDRELLGANAGTIKLENIVRLSTNPKRSELDISYKQEDRTATHQIVFSSPAVRDEALAALELRLEAGFGRREQTYPIQDKILPPVLALVVIAIIGWVLIGGLPLLSQLQIFQSGVLQLVLNSIQQFVNLFGAINLLLIDIILILLCLLWLVVNLYKPTRLLTVEKL